MNTSHKCNLDETVCESCGDGCEYCDGAHTLPKPHDPATMIASRELDALLAQHLFGWKHLVDLTDADVRARLKETYPNKEPSDEDIMQQRIEWDLMDSYYDLPWLNPHGLLADDASIPYYSTDICDAWQIINLFRRGSYPRPDGNSVACVIELTITDDILHDDCEVKIYSPTQAEVVATASDMPLAICRAALLAIGYKEN